MAYKTSANLFEVGDFISHAGNKLAWKIECDAMLLVKQLVFHVADCRYNMLQKSM